MRFLPKEHELSCLKIARRVNIEKRIQRFNRPIGDRAAVFPLEILDPAHIVADKSMAQIRPDCDGPECGQRMQPAA